MLGLTVAVVLQIAAVGETRMDYPTAYQEAEKTGKPLVVLVGTEWCPACVTMKRSIMPKLLRTGRLRNVVYTEVDADMQPRIAHGIMSGGGYPQLAIFRKTGQGWKRKIIVGAQSEGTIETLVQRAVKAQETEVEVAELPATTSN